MPDGCMDWLGLALYVTGWFWGELKQKALEGAWCLCII